MRENRLRWSNHVHKGPVDVKIRKIDCLDVIGTSRRRERPKKAWLKIEK